MLLDIRLPSSADEPASTRGTDLIAFGLNALQELQVKIRARLMLTKAVLLCRLDRLRSVVPHAERANTASFLEEVIKYIQDLQKRIADLEATGAQAPNSTAKLDSPPAGYGQPHEELRVQQPHAAVTDIRTSSSFEPSFDSMRHTAPGIASAISDPAQGPPSPGRSAVNASYESMSLKKRKLDDAT